MDRPRSCDICFNRGICSYRIGLQKYVAVNRHYITEVTTQLLMIRLDKVVALDCDRFIDELNVVREGAVFRIKEGGGRAGHSPDSYF